MLNFDSIREKALKLLEGVKDEKAFIEAEIEILGRKSKLSNALHGLKDMSPDERKKIGKEGNELRAELQARFDEKHRLLKLTGGEETLKKEKLDVTRPGKKNAKGHIHPISQVIRDIVSIFSSMGFEVQEGPEVETEYYNFDALNIPANHPARDMWDTFWLKSEAERLLLRTHTSPVQVRYMESHNPPLKIIVPGRAYRYEATDASHGFQFFQLEGLVVDRHISIANFKAVIQEFFSRLFKKDVTVRLRPSYFPFVEPGFEVDISCVICGGKGCSVCKRSGWLELAGAGMVHPNVFKAAGYAPGEWQGFAFGFGIERVAMMKYKIPDIRLFHSGDLKFLKQF
jgi:phenylalanyl-tRNA synthetase alpha chain